MMRRTIIGAIAKKELKESLRDRRTLFLMVFLPILLYPALLVLISQVTLLKLSELETSQVTVGVLGAPQDHPMVDALLEDETVAIITVDEVSFESANVVLDLSDWSSENEQVGSSPVRLHYESVSESSLEARDRTETAITDWIDLEMARRLEAEALPESFIDPIDYTAVNEADETAQGGFLLAALLPLLVLVTVLMGAYYPAIDLTAGEKERGTIQTLFTAPVSALEIVTGKYIAVVGIACVSGGANLVSMALVMGQNLILSDELAADLDLSIGLATFFALALTIVAIALLFSALMMAVAVLARSFKEAQTYVTPIYLICILPAMVAQLPGFDYTPAVGLIPAVGPILLMKSLLMSGVEAQAVLLVCGSTTLYALLTLVVAARLFGQESVIVGERGGIRLIPRRSELKPRSAPPLSAALAWFCVLFVLFFYVGSVVQTWDLQLGLVITLWGVMLAPTVALCVWARWRLETTFLVKAPPRSAWPLALFIAFGGIVLVNAANDWLSRLGLEPPAAYLEQMSDLIATPEGLLAWLAAFFVLALTPAFCEEYLFRGFLLTSLRGHVKDGTAIVVTAVLFGLFHLDVYRLFGTTVLGLLLGYMTVRTRSIFPAVLVHALNNGSAIIAMMLGVESLRLNAPLLAAAAIALGFGVYGLNTLRPPRD